MNLGVLTSGRGSNLQAIINAINDHKLKSNIRLVISNKRSNSLNIANNHMIKNYHIPHDSMNRQIFENKVLKLFKENEVNFVVLAGFMRILTLSFISEFKDKIINIHPSLLPAFPGAHAQEDAFNHGVKITGCTVHLVDEGLDSGKILIQRAININSDWTIDMLKDNLLKEEHIAIVDALKLIEEIYEQYN